MSDDEVFVMIVTSIAAAFAWSIWIIRAGFGAHSISVPRERFTLTTAPLLVAAVLYVLLRAFADAEVRDSVVYMSFYMAMGLAWVGIFASFTPLLGISMRDDAIERRNPAATHAITGVVLGLAYAFTGGNIGDGPGWWVVFFCAALATITFFLIWLIVETAAHISDAITIDRNVGAALRFSGFLQAIGIVLGRAVAGDWHSFTATVIDFGMHAWPVVLLAAFEIAYGRTRIVRPAPRHGYAGWKPHKSSATGDVFVGIAYIAAAIGWLFFLGWWT